MTRPTREEVELDLVPELADATTFLRSYGGEVSKCWSHCKMIRCWGLTTFYIWFLLHLFFILLEGIRKLKGGMFNNKRIRNNEQQE